MITSRFGAPAGENRQAVRAGEDAQTLTVMVSDLTVLTGWTHSPSIETIILSHLLDVL